MSAQRLTIEAMRLSSTRSFHRFPDLPELEPQHTPADRDVLASHGRESVGFVLLGVLGVADPDQRLFEEADDRGEHLLARQSLELHVGCDPVAQRGQRGRELDDVLIFVLVAEFAPFRMVAVLLAAAHPVRSPGCDRSARDRSKRIRRPAECRST